MLWSLRTGAKLSPRVVRIAVEPKEPEAAGKVVFSFVLQLSRVKNDMFLLTFTLSVPSTR